MLGMLAIRLGVGCSQSKQHFSHTGRGSSAYLAINYKKNVEEGLSCIFTRIASEIFDA